jgi:hypothetical protein
MFVEDFREKAFHRVHYPFEACTGEVGALPRTPAPPTLTMREEITMQRRSDIVMSLLLVGFAVF